MQLALKVYVNLHPNFSGTNLRITAQPFSVTYYVVVDIEMMGELYNYKLLHNDCEDCDIVLQNNFEHSSC